MLKLCRSCASKHRLMMKERRMVNTMIHHRWVRIVWASLLLWFVNDRVIDFVFSTIWKVLLVVWPLLRFNIANLNICLGELIFFVGWFIFLEHYLNWTFFLSCTLGECFTNSRRRRLSDDIGLRLCSSNLNLPLLYGRDILAPFLTNKFWRASSLSRLRFDTLWYFHHII